MPDRYAACRSISTTRILTKIRLTKTVQIIVEPSSTTYRYNIRFFLQREAQSLNIGIPLQHSSWSKVSFHFVTVFYSRYILPLFSRFTTVFVFVMPVTHWDFTRGKKKGKVRCSWSRNRKEGTLHENSCRSQMNEKIIISWSPRLFFAITSSHNNFNKEE